MDYDDEDLSPVPKSRCSPPPVHTNDSNDDGSDRTPSPKLNRRHPWPDYNNHDDGEDLVPAPSAVKGRTESYARLVVLDTWKSAIRKTILEESCTLRKNHNECRDQLSRKFGEAWVTTPTAKRIVGCTATGAAKFAQGIRAAKPDQ
jgi:hypothetical protein